MVVTSHELDQAREALVGRRELALLDEPSVQAMVALLVRRCRQSAPWVRAAVGTLDRFAREVASGDLPGLLAAGRADASAAARSLQQLARRHDGLSPGQVAGLALGPKLWWTAAGVEVPWRSLATSVATSSPLPGVRTDADMRLLLLAVIGSGATQDELLGVRVGDAGRLDQFGDVVPDLQAEPLALSVVSASGGPRFVTFLPFEARQALLERIGAGQARALDEPLLISPDAAPAAAAAATQTGTSLIAAGNDVNVTMCRATGDFFRQWGMPGARFEARVDQD